MENETIVYLRDDFIKLGQALKASGVAQSGVDAKIMVQDGLVKVNGQKCLQRGKKLVDGDIIEAQGARVMVKKPL